VVLTSTRSLAGALLTCGLRIRDFVEVSDAVGDAHTGEGLEEVASVAFGFYSWVEDGDDAAVGAAADEAANSLFECDDGLRDAVFEKRLAAILVDEPRPSRDYRFGRER